LPALERDPFALDARTDRALDAVFFRPFVVFFFFAVLRMARALADGRAVRLAAGVTLRMARVAACDVVRAASSAPRATDLAAVVVERVAASAARPTLAGISEARLASWPIPSTPAATPRLIRFAPVSMTSLAACAVC